MFIDYALGRRQVPNLLISLGPRPCLGLPLIGSMHLVWGRDCHESSIILTQYCTLRTKTASVIVVVHEGEPFECMHTWTCKLICMRCSLNGAWRSMHTEYLPLFGGRIDTNQSRHWFHGAATTREMRQLRVLFFRTVPLLLIVYPIFSFAATSSIPYDLIVYQQPGSTTGVTP